MKNFIITFIISIFLFNSVLAYEVTTHQELTRRAIDGDNRAENLKFFLRSFDLENVDYSEEGDTTLYWIAGTFTTENATGSYHNVTERLTSAASVGLNITVPNNYRGTIESGAVLEDSALSDEGPDITHGRFNRHFYDIHEPGCYGLKGTATCSREWGFDGGGANDNNLFTWVSAHDYYLAAITENEETDRRLAQANLFLTAGHLSHLLEDLTQPSHTRNDSHPGGGLGNLAGGPTAIEPWASENFNTRINNIDGLDALINNGAVFNPTSYRQVFDNTALFVHNNFFSDDTILGQFSDGDHGSPTLSDIVENQIDRTKYYYMQSTNLPNNTRLAIHTVKTLWKDSYDLVATIQDEVDNTVLEDNVKVLFPIAIARAEGMINFMFRARILATPDKSDNNKLIVKNITSQSEINQTIDTTIKNGATIHILYDTVDGQRKTLLPTVNLDSDLVNDDEFVIEGFQDAIDQVSLENLEDDQKIGDEKKITIAIDGLMGGDDQNEDWIVAGSSFNFINQASVLFSFDRSGSMGQEINNAKESAIRVIPILAGGTDNSASVHSFSSSVRLDQDYTSDFTLIRDVINNINSSGTTALYDAIFHAGDRALQEKLTNPDKKSIVILYTDGIENSSSNSREQAIQAISKVDHPEIDVVYLVFLGSDSNGSSILSDIAAQSGRNFLQLQSTDQLASELINIIK